MQADASKRTGCFDLTCPGFVQTSSEIALGAAIYPISIPGGLPYQITIYIYKVRIWMINHYGLREGASWHKEKFAALQPNGHKFKS